MGSYLILWALWLLGPRTSAAQDASPAAEQEASDASKHGDEGEAKGSRGVITPITVFPQKEPYAQSLEELVQAQELWKKGQAEAASDIALEVYDDLSAVWVPRKQRPKRRLQKHQAATVYIEASIAYIQDFVQKSSGTPKAVAEGRARLGDLRDVARNYPDLNKRLKQTIDRFSLAPSTSTSR
jgi:hypothetical protein